MCASKLGGKTGIVAPTASNLRTSRLCMIPPLEVVRKRVLVKTPGSGTGFRKWAVPAGPYRSVTGLRAVGKKRGSVAGWVDCRTGGPLIRGEKAEIDYLASVYVRYAYGKKKPAGIPKDSGRAGSNGCLGTRFCIRLNSGVEGTAGSVSGRCGIRRSRQPQRVAVDAARADRRC